MSRIRRLRKATRGLVHEATFVFWRGGDRISIDGRKLTETEFDKYCDEHLPANAKVIVTGWDVRETVEADGSGTIEMVRKSSERKKPTV